MEIYLTPQKSSLILETRYIYLSMIARPQHVDSVQTRARELNKEYILSIARHNSSDSKPGLLGLGHTGISLALGPSRLG